MLSLKLNHGGKGGSHLFAMLSNRPRAMKQLGNCPWDVKTDWFMLLRTQEVT